MVVERIKSIEMSEKPFDWPMDFDPEAFLNKAFGLYWDDQFTAKIKFPASQARYIKERKLAEQQHIMSCLMAASSSLWRRLAAIISNAGGCHSGQMRNCWN